MNHGPKAIVFDMDGVLINSGWLHEDAKCEALRLAGIDVSTERLASYTDWNLIETRLPDTIHHPGSHEQECSL
jgi:beta-phosphoglucomutase-like phosphatase (HAD superfamily)